MSCAIAAAWAAICLGSRRMPGASSWRPFVQDLRAVIAAADVKERSGR